MSSHYEAPIRKPLVIGDKSFHDVTVDVAAPVEGKANKHWWIVFSIALAAFLWGLGCIIYTISTGIGTWGLNKTVGWAWDITNFVWWVGIGHAGTLISAVLLLFRQRWRMAINRSAEAMTIFSVIQAGLFPIIHMGRPWLAYWVLPIPNQFGSLWVNFNSPLLWDVFAISTYLSVSLVFWWTGLLPDFAMIRDRAVNPFTKRIYSILSFGWSGRAKGWQHQHRHQQPDGHFRHLALWPSCLFFSGLGHGCALWIAWDQGIVARGASGKATNAPSIVLGVERSQPAKHLDDACNVDIGKGDADLPLARL
jgi:molybdopterin-containing oxidoreductase family membrane subunit